MNLTQNEGKAGGGGKGEMDKWKKVFLAVIL